MSLTPVELAEWPDIYNGVRGRFETGRPVTANAGATAADLLAGDGARVRIILVGVPVITIDPESSGAIGPTQNPLTDGALASVSIGGDYIVIRREDVGDIITQPMRVQSTTAAFVVWAWPVRFRPMGA